MAKIKVTDMDTEKFTGNYDIEFVKTKFPKFLSVIKKSDDDETLNYAFLLTEENPAIVSSTTIKSKCFLNETELKAVKFSSELKTIENNVFEGCTELKEIYSADFTSENQNQITISKEWKNEKDSLIIQSSAFLNCSKLHTVILPVCNELVIEKSAFEGCSALRTVVCFANKISFTGNPFSDCSENLTFVGQKNSEIERFARENNYRFIDA